MKALKKIGKILLGIAVVIAYICLIAFIQNIDDVKIKNVEVVR